MDEVKARSFWLSSEVGYSFTNSSGRSGGLLTLWNPINVEVLSSFKGEVFLGIKVCWKDNLSYIVNIYLSYVLSKKKCLWNDLLALKESFKDGEWIKGGGFNSIKNSSERKGRDLSMNHKEEELFSEFIDKTLLVDNPCKGKKFSWFGGDGKAMSRIDLFLLSSNIVNRWEVIGQFIGDRDISDHCPIWIMTDHLNWGPKLFRFNNEWFSFDSFIPFVEKEWKSMKMEGRGNFLLKEKLRFLKDKLRSWNKGVFGKIDLEMEEGVLELNIADERLVSESNSFIADNLVLRKEACSKFWRNLRIKESMLLQKSRLGWLKEGDSNSGFFHKVMKKRRRHNHLGPVLTLGGLVESLVDVKEAVYSHFGNNFIESEEVRPLLAGIYFNSISGEEAMEIEKPFLENEIIEAVWNCRGDKSPVVSNHAPGYKYNARCAYQSNSPGHDTEDCGPLTHNIQDLIDDKITYFNSLEEPHMTDVAHNHNCNQFVRAVLISKPAPQQ
ncbi:uncharacterized protein LOC131658925 [Vicia villosa]|uniref:uncharacterized protein LOC131658925 n=1 Tax=Vicia villosa TaxID=3911 RepID=UPI00273ACE48|nr:uncharacterized protein LOC131658925 [Vicia villosa]